MIRSKKKRLKTERQLWALCLLATCRELLEEMDNPTANEVKQQIDLWFRGKHTPRA